MAGRYESKETCSCGNPTMPNRNVCQECFRIANTEASRKFRLRRRETIAEKKNESIQKEIPLQTDREITVMPKKHYYRIAYT